MERRWAVCHWFGDFRPSKEEIPPEGRDFLAADHVLAYRHTTLFCRQWRRQSTRAPELQPILHGICQRPDCNERWLEAWPEMSGSSSESAEPLEVIDLVSESSDAESQASPPGSVASGSPQAPGTPSQ